MFLHVFIGLISDYHINKRDQTFTEIHFLSSDELT